MCENPTRGYLSGGGEINWEIQPKAIPDETLVELPSIPASDPALPANEVLFDSWGQIPTIGTLIEYEQAD